MENTIFGLFLFIFVYGFLLWVTDGGNLTTTSSTDSSNSANRDAETVSHKASNSVGQIIDLEDANPLAVNLASDMATSQDKPIEQQLKDVLWEDENPHQDEPAASSTEQANTITEDEVNELTLRQARKVARKLDIRQKVNGKDAFFTTTAITLVD